MLPAGSFCEAMIRPYLDWTSLQEKRKVQGSFTYGISKHQTRKNITILTRYDFGGSAMFLFWPRALPRDPKRFLRLSKINIPQNWDIFWIFLDFFQIFSGHFFSSIFWKKIGNGLFKQTKLIILWVHILSKFVLICNYLNYLKIGFLL